MYVMLGATGQVGGSVLKTLRNLEPDAPLRIVGRRAPQALPPGVEWRDIDVSHDVDALASAFEGAKAAFVLNPVPPDAEDVWRAAAQISETIAAAIVRAGRPRIVALSSQGAHLREGTGVIAALHGFEKALRATGAPLTCVRSTFFMESWLPFAAAAIETGEFMAMRSPPDARDNAVSARDVGAVIADVLRDCDAPAVINVTGPGTCSEADAAAALAAVSGQPIRLVEIPAADRAGTLEAAGLSASYAAALADMYAALDAGRVPFEPAPETRRGMTTLQDVFRAAFARP